MLYEYEFEEAEVESSIIALKERQPKGFSPLSATARTQMPPSIYLS